MKQVIQTSHAPSPKGPYSQAIRANGFLFVAGQIPIDVSGNVVRGEIEEQTRAVLNNLAAILRAADSDLSQVVKTTGFIADMALFARMNAVYAEYFPNEAPARSTVQVGMPGGMLLEIECVAEVK